MPVCERSGKYAYTHVHVLCTSLGEVKCKKEIWSQSQIVIRNCQAHNSEISVRREEGMHPTYSVDFKSECSWKRCVLLRC